VETNREELTDFTNQANNHHPTIKFTAEISDTEATFLATSVNKTERFTNRFLIKFTSCSNSYSGILDLDFTLKHCSSNHNNSVILNFRKRVSRLETTGAINVKKKPSEGGHIIVQRIPLTQVRMQKSFKSLLVKFNVSTQETCCQNFFSSPLYVHEFFLGQ